MPANMERVTFLIEGTNQRLRCMLNPESLELRRRSGIRSRTLQGSFMTSDQLSDDPVIYTGGGRTEFELALLFDVALEGSSFQTEDVRDLTSPLWSLAENPAVLTSSTRYEQPPIVRLIWGKAWNVRGVITAVAERLERFTLGGVPQRSWLRMSFRRVSDPKPDTLGLVDGDPAQFTPPEAWYQPDIPDIPDEDVVTYEVVGGGGTSPVGAAERLEDIAARFYGRAEAWRWLARINNIEDPLRLVPGSRLRILPLPESQRG